MYRAFAEQARWPEGDSRGGQFKNGSGGKPAGFKGNYDIGDVVREKGSKQVLGTVSRFEGQSAIVQSNNAYLGNNTWGPGETRTHMSNIERSPKPKKSKDQEEVGNNNLPESKTPIVKPGHLNEEQHRAMAGYQDDYTSGINHGLRAGNPSDQHVKHMDAALSNQIPTTSPVTVYRAMDSALLDKIGNGGSFTDRGFTSTTRSKDIADEYAYSDVNVNGKSWSGRTVRIEVPKGRKVLDYDNHPQFQNNLNFGMAEVLLPRGSTFIHTVERGEHVLRLL